MDEKEKKNLLRIVEETAREFRETVASIRQSVQNNWERLAGYHLGMMMKSPSATAQYLSNADPKLREAALYIFNYHWGLNRTLAPNLERMALEDEDDDVSGIALLYLVSLYQGTDDSRIGKLLAAFVKDVSLSTEYRTTAYFGLFCLRGLSSKHWPHIWSPKWHLPADVDWSFVDSFS